MEGERERVVEKEGERRPAATWADKCSSLVKAGCAADSSWRKDNQCAKAHTAWVRIH